MTRSPRRSPFPGPRAKASNVASAVQGELAATAAENAGKERVLADTLGTVPEGEVHIDDVPSMGDWKTAWDHIAFDGFLGVRMVLRTTWQGCDSALAAPLVLDLARLLARAHEAGIAGPVPEFGFHCKDPEVFHTGSN